MLGQLDGKPYVVVFTQSTARGVSLDDGEELWQYDRANNGTANVATPIIHDNHVFLSSDYGTGAGLLELTADGDRVHAKEVYFTRDMRNHHCTSVLVDGHLYGFSGQTLNCIVFATGKLKWNKRSVGKGSLVYADGHLYCFSEKGVVGLVEATPQAYREKGRFELARSEWESWAHPVVVGGRLYLRDQDKIRAYDVTAEKVSRIDSPVRPRTYEQLVKGFR
jgi:hypothetical protein